MRTPKVFACRDLGLIVALSISRHVHNKPSIRIILSWFTYLITLSARANTPGGMEADFFAGF